MLCLRRIGRGRHGSILQEGVLASGESHSLSVSCGTLWSYACSQQSGRVMQYARQLLPREIDSSVHWL